MKAMMIFGALVGFLIGIGSALAGLSSWPTALWRASAGALIAALLTRWWTGVWLHGLQDALNQRRSPRQVLSPNPKAVAKS